MNEAEFHAEAIFAPLLHEIGIDGDSVFTDPRIRVWRSLPDRENATLDVPGENSKPIRLHIKRYPAPFGFMAKNEVEGFRLLQKAGVPAAAIVAHGFSTDGRGFVILEDLADYTPADKLLEKGFAFDRLLDATAELAALLHNRQLHHRDLYLCHFMIRPAGDRVDAKLIDMTRVARLNSVLTRRRWIIKDLGQFWYSTQSLNITEAQREQWLRRYCQMREIKFDRFIGPVQAKAVTIARHDARLRKKQPNRNVSI